MLPKSSLFSFSFFAVSLLAGNRKIMAGAQLLAVERLGTYSGMAAYDASAAEIVAFDEASGLLLVTNANTDAVDVLSIDDPTMPTLVKSLNDTGLSPNSVAVYNGLAAVALEAPQKEGNGTIGFYNLMTDSGTFLGGVTVCVLPDMVTFTPDGTMVVTACEGEPTDAYDIDPEGAVAVIDVPAGGSSVDGAMATIINLQEFDGHEEDLIAMGVRIYGPNATASMDLEPEYIVVSADSMMATVVCQENNAFITINLVDRTVMDIHPLGFKDHSLFENRFDASNRDDGINLMTWPTMGMYQPDGMVGFTIGGRQYYASANEGDSRDYDGYSEEERVGDLDLSPELLAFAPDLQDDAMLGRLKCSTAFSDADGDGLVDHIYSYGARSFSVFDEDLNMIYDSGSILEEVTAEIIPEMFNANNDENDSFDSRSDDKGPEPEAIVYANIGSNHYLFVLLERVSAIAVFNVADPAAPVFESLFNNRIWTGDAEEGTAGDLGPESGVFIPHGPTGDPLLVVANEVSGTTTIYSLTAPEEPSQPPSEQSEPPEPSEPDNEVLGIIGNMVVLMTDIIAVLPDMLGVVQIIITAPARLLGN